MALTDTKKAKDFMAGAPDITLKGDLRPMKMASAPDPMDERNNMMESLSLKYYGKPLKDLTEDEIIDLEEAFDDLTTKKNAPSMMMAADGGRAEFQEGGGIMPRLNQLGSGVSSAEQMLQGINERLQSAESSLGSGGGGTLANLASFTPSVSAAPSNVLALKGSIIGQGPFGGPLYNEIPEQFRSGFNEFMKGKPIPMGGQAMSSVMLPGGGSVRFGDTGSAGAFRKYLESTGFTPPSGLGRLPGGGANTFSPMQQAMGFADGGRAKYGLGSLVKSVKKAVKGVVKGVKDNPLLAAAALNFAPMLLPGGKPFFGLGGLKGSVKTLFEGSSPLGFLNLTGDEKGMGAFTDTLKIAGLGGTVAGLIDQLTREEGESDQDFINRTAEVKDQLKVQFKRLNPQQANESASDYDIRIDAMVANAQGAQGSFAVGGRVMKAMGDSASDNAMQAAGVEGLPIRQNTAGITELDLRKSGGFIPPVGVKEKADDIPAMLSNNEFVFTADAVRAAGGGSVNKGAQRMYDLMKSLESRVV